MIIKKLALSISLSIPLIFIHTDNSQAAKVFRWVDDLGQIHYDDKITPESITKERDELNSQGIKLGTTKAARTVGEIAEENRIKAKQQARIRQLKEQKQYDDMLLATFTSVEDMIRNRDGKITALESSVQLTKASLVRLHKTLGNLHKKIDGNKNKESKYVKKLIHEALETGIQIEQQKEYIILKQQAQDKIREKFDKDISRFKELTQVRDKTEQ
ncbi:MAG: DUF4124 domain-containing protein [Gammaproteobacteria bacterium]|nr:DUF4124 domain-containing protein [Gammaproteobacteria bacterium]